MRPTAQSTPAAERAPGGEARRAGRNEGAAAARGRAHSRDTRALLARHQHARDSWVKRFDHAIEHEKRVQSGVKRCTKRAERPVVCEKHAGSTMQSCTKRAERPDRLREACRKHHAAAVDPAARKRFGKRRIVANNRSQPDQIGCCNKRRSASREALSEAPPGCAAAGRDRLLDLRRRRPRDLPGRATRRRGSCDDARIVKSQEHAG